MDSFLENYDNIRKKKESEVAEGNENIFFSMKLILEKGWGRYSVPRAVLFHRITEACPCLASVGIGQLNSVLIYLIMLFLPPFAWVLPGVTFCSWD